MKQKNTTTIGIIEEQPLYRAALQSIIKKITNYKLLVATNTIKDFLKKLKKRGIPQVIITGNNITKTREIENILSFKRNFELTNILYLINNTDTLTQMILFKHGISWQLEKSSTKAKLLFAIDATIQQKSYLPDTFSDKTKEREFLKNFTKRELLFLKYFCADFSYENIAREMKIKRSTVNDYCKSIFYKSGVNTRQGLLIKMLKEKVINI